MPEAKRLRGSRAAGVKAKPQVSPPSQEDARPTPAEVEEEEHPFVQLAQKHWLSSKGKKRTKSKLNKDVLKAGLWDPLEREGFPHKSLLLLESLQILESFLWPDYTEDSSNHHILLIALVANVKQREHLQTWNIFEDRPADFSSFFRRLLSLQLDRTLGGPIRTQLLCFMINAFKSLDFAIVRKECASLVSINIWSNLSSDDVRETRLEQAAHLRKVWRSAARKYDAAEDATKSRLRFERSWLYSLVLDFIRTLHEDAGEDQLHYCERFVELMSDLVSQLPTRRYVNALFLDLQVLSAIKLSPMFLAEHNQLLRDLQALLSHYIYFTVDDQTGVQYTSTQAYDKHCALLGRLQSVALKSFKDKLLVLALSNYGAINKRIELQPLLEVLTDDELRQLSMSLGMRQCYPDNVNLHIDRKFLLEMMLETFEWRKTFQDKAETMALSPTEISLFDAVFQRADAYDGSRPLALPKLNLQYLSVGDFLWRSLVLSRYELFYGIRKDIESALRRLRPEASLPSEVNFAGFSRMAMPISKPSILEVVPALVGQEYPAAVRSEVSFDVKRLNERVRREWDSLKTDDAVFLLAVRPEPSQNYTNGGPVLSEAEKLGLVTVRTATVVSITDEKGRHVRDGANRLDSKRRLELRLDPQSYVKDASRAESVDVYGQINILLRREKRENNFMSILASIRRLVLSDYPLPSWLHEVFLGYGDPTAANFKNMSHRIGKMDYSDTFLNWQHLIESLPGRMIDPADSATGSFGPPYVLETKVSDREQKLEPASKKRRRDNEQPGDVETLKVSTYKPPNMGPYPVDVPHKNTVRFTPAQTDAILSGSQPGLTVIVGPPGTGKTDVATQIIRTLYHNFPKQRTLLIAHSNQALNQLFAKIVALDIDSRHLLRLGHGEEDLGTEASFSKYGRVESFLENRDRYLLEVRKLAATLNAPGAHDKSAETAGYFNAVYIEPAWLQFVKVADSDDTPVSDIVRAFPFHGYFSDAPQPLFPDEASRIEVLEIAHGCFRHIAKIFSELADVIPFEILRRERDKANYLLTSEARIVAMTTTHAAIRRDEIAELGFHYDNIVMEEAAQNTEIDTFIPLAMQKPVDGRMSLQRVVLCGDHYQNSPVIQSLAFRHYANLEQSLFSRLVRLGVPTIFLNQQGRARPSIASIYRWRYPGLGDLPNVESDSEFLTANAGFKFDYQFINVPDYKGLGEAEPTPHFIQNLGEAEYAVAIFQYMRLLGYPADKISILTTYAGQRALVRDVLDRRCARNPIFGVPKAVATVDKYQGEQNDYIIVSLTRTSRVGYLRDIRRMTVAMSRARLGLYVLGRRAAFEACPELRPAFDILLQRPDKLMLVTGEMWPAQRTLTLTDVEVENEVPMESVEHLGQFVYEMTNTRMAQPQSEAESYAEKTLPEADAKEDGEPLDHDADAPLEPDILEVREGED